MTPLHKIFVILVPFATTTWRHYHKLTHPTNEKSRQPNTLDVWSKGRQGDTINVWSKGRQPDTLDV